MIYVPALWRDSDTSLPDKVHFVMECNILKSRGGTPLVWAAINDHPSAKVEGEYYRLVRNKRYGIYVLVTHSDVQGMGYPNVDDVRRELDFYLPQMVSYLRFEKAQKRGASLTAPLMGSQGVK